MIREEEDDGCDEEEAGWGVQGWSYFDGSSYQIKLSISLPSIMVASERVFWGGTLTGRFLYDPEAGLWGWTYQVKRWGLLFPTPPTLPTRRSSDLKSSQLYKS